MFYGFFNYDKLARSLWAVVRNSHVQTVNDQILTHNLRKYHFLCPVKTDQNSYLQLQVLFFSFSLITLEFGTIWMHFKWCQIAISLGVYAYATMGKIVSKGAGWVCLGFWWDCFLNSLEGFHIWPWSTLGFLMRNWNALQGRGTSRLSEFR